MMAEIKIMRNVVMGATVGAIDDPRALAAVNAAIKEAADRHHALTMYLIYGYPEDIARRMIAAFEENEHDPLAMLEYMGPYKEPEITEL